MTLTATIEALSADAGLLHDIVHGGPTDSVETDGGLVKSIAKAVADAESAIGTFIPRGAWAPDTDYAARDLTTSGGVTYVSLIGHLSSGSFSADLAAGKWTIHQGITREELSADTGGERINARLPYTNAVPRSQRERNRDRPSIEDFGARPGPGYDCADAFYRASLETDAVYIPRRGKGSDAWYQVPGGIPYYSGLTISGPGVIQSDGAHTALTVGPGMVVEGITLVGRKATEESGLSDIGVQATGPGYALRHVKVRNFAATGIDLNHAGDAYSTPSMLDRVVATECGTGINTHGSEYITLAAPVITRCGINNDGDDWTPLHGSGDFGYGLFGNLANCYVHGGQVIANAWGVYLRSTGGANPDHGTVIGLVVNHNGACGVQIEGTANWHLFDGLVALSNIGLPGAPGIVHPTTGSCHSLVLVDAFAIQFIGGAIDVGHPSNTDIPAYGFGRCKFLGVKLKYGPVVGKRHPAAGSFLKDFYGYDYNADNVFRDCEHDGFDDIPQLAGTLRSLSINPLRNGHLTDGVPQSLTLLNGWAAAGKCQYVRIDGNRVKVRIYATAPGSVGTVIANLPAGWRPSETHQADAAVGPSLTSSYATIYASGDITVVGALAGQPVRIDAEFFL